jgi:hypothetical protein
LNHRTLIAAALLAAALVTSCSSDDEGTQSAAAAKDVAKRFHEAVAKGDAAAAARLAQVPFRYKGPERKWDDQAELEKNLAKEVRRIQHLVAGLDEFEAFSREDLEGGKWPRSKDVPKERREAEISALGVLPRGFLVRVFSASKPGYTLVVNPDGDRLAVQGLDI